ncbi:hypothetical protein BO86DRAFT_401170 [Aspergillus japonicus CBS 114.51]|uniref:Uncharacterized protein n=1 Tax=Aspergillus japonicus CBS 114.51 TaxID=1448312 RepID=A0A8T8WWI4_ASPJA|nr:hypothetical protein BO86DRAFT_401170 [Aspergillus japonicus CBS 114.51]RAH80173.1 hypothetical protein BO86DRAFT_401170 [Aspergillus japonicus CBS 114.51]
MRSPCTILLLFGLAGRLTAAADPMSQEECDKLCQMRFNSPRAVGQLYDVHNGLGSCDECTICTGEGGKYTDPITQRRRCCDEKNQVFLTGPEGSKLGKCCDASQAYLADASAQHGDCCPATDHIYLWDTKSQSGSCCPIGTAYFDGQKCQPKSDPAPEPDTINCKPHGVCASSSKTTGLKQGHCYRLKDTQNRTLSIRRGALDYILQTEYEDLYHFKVCASTTECAASDKEVAVGDPFFLQDEFGQWTVDGAGWIDKRCSDHLYFTRDANSAGAFQAAPWCFNGKCGMCLKSGVEACRGLEVICPATSPGIGRYVNANYCLPMFVEEVPCMSEVFGGEGFKTEL